jgi:hypothetical protein
MIARDPSERSDNRWKVVKEMDKLLDCLEGRMDSRAAVIQSTSAQKRLLSPAAAAEVSLNVSTDDSSEDLMHLCLGAASKNTG